MSENRMLTDKEIENLANSHAEKEAFMKSTIVFVLVWLAGFLTLPLVPDRSYLFLRNVISLRVLYFVVSFLVAFVAGLITRWIVKESAYEKFYTFYKEQQKRAAF